MAVVTTALARSLGRSGPVGPDHGGPGALMVRNFWVMRRAWVVVASGFFEPVFFLLSIGVGIGAIVSGFTVMGEEIPYKEFVAPAMLAASAMNGAIMDSTFNVFFKLKFEKVYDAVLATPLGPRDVARAEIGWAVSRGGLYATGFLLVMLAMGLLSSWWALLALPAALLTSFAFAGVGMALTTFMKSWQDFELVLLAIMPMFLFSATFYPVETYGDWRWLVEVTPLYRAVVLMRELCTGLLSEASLVSVAYLATMGVIGMTVAGRRIGKLLLT
ncbi:ABC transporter permease [Nocardioides sp. HDW12B]|uniref:ABC transporter permease n=1 Tax=Nocardioides sp. HDW12B TaxID=2714939 RepID=UPI001F0DAE62|nr:ABC transporter permease [Nocardioides sp. HDW12B]